MERYKLITNRLFKTDVANVALFLKHIQMRNLVYVWLLLKRSFIVNLD